MLNLCHSSGFHADYLVTKCGVLMMSLFVFFTTTMSVSFTLRETQTRMLKFTGLFNPTLPPLFRCLIYTNSVNQSIEPSQLNIYTFCLKLDLFFHLMCCKRVSKISSCCWISWWVSLMDTRIEVAHYEGATINQASSCTYLKFPFCQFIAVQLQHHARHRLPTFQLIFVHVIESLVFVPVSIHFYFICMHIYQTILKLS